jgi:hypothetical protein
MRTNTSDTNEDHHWEHNFLTPQFGYALLRSSVTGGLVHRTEDSPLRRLRRRVGIPLRIEEQCRVPRAAPSTRQAIQFLRAWRRRFWKR